MITFTLAATALVDDDTLGALLEQGATVESIAELITLPEGHTLTAVTCPSGRRLPAGPVSAEWARMLNVARLVGMGHLPHAALDDIKASVLQGALDPSNV